mmetsp:Transcript_39257/g.89968  ORF Transcript_39257/g.89968 Transcript_39257/m.89968 type:complete len:286 (-) Transcript_39257:120-977(-)
MSVDHITSRILACHYGEKLYHPTDSHEQVVYVLVVKHVKHGGHLLHVHFVGVRGNVELRRHKSLPILPPPQELQLRRDLPKRLHHIIQHGFSHIIFPQHNQDTLQGPRQQQGVRVRPSHRVELLHDVVGAHTLLESGIISFHQVTNQHEQRSHGFTPRHLLPHGRHFSRAAEGLQQRNEFDVQRHRLEALHCLRRTSRHAGSYGDDVQPESTLGHVVDEGPVVDGSKDSVHDALHLHDFEAELVKHTEPGHQPRVHRVQGLVGEALGAFDPDPLQSGHSVVIVKF